MNPLIYLVERKNLAFNTQLHKSTEREVSDEYHSLSCGFLKPVSAKKMHKVQDSRILFSYIRSHTKKIKKIQGALKTPVLVPGLQVAEFYCCTDSLSNSNCDYAFTPDIVLSVISLLLLKCGHWTVLYIQRNLRKGYSYSPPLQVKGNTRAPDLSFQTPQSAALFTGHATHSLLEEPFMAVVEVSVAPKLTLSLFFTSLMHKLTPSKGPEALGTSPADAPVWWELPHPAVRLYSYKRLQHRLKGF